MTVKRKKQSSITITLATNTTMHILVSTLLITALLQCCVHSASFVSTSNSIPKKLFNSASSFQNDFASLPITGTCTRTSSRQQTIISPCTMTTNSRLLLHAIDPNTNTNDNSNSNTVTDSDSDWSDMDSITAEVDEALRAADAALNGSKQKQQQIVTDSNVPQTTTSSSSSRLYMVDPKNRKNDIDSQSSTRTTIVDEPVQKQQQQQQQQSTSSSGIPKVEFTTPKISNNPTVITESIATAVGTLPIGIILGLIVVQQIPVLALEEPVTPALVFATILSITTTSLSLQEENSIGQFFRSTIGKSVLGIGDNIKGSIQTSIDNTVQSIQAIPDNIAIAVQKQVDTTKESITSIPDKISQTANDIAESTKLSAQQKINNTKQQIQNIPSLIQQKAQIVVQDVTSEIQKTPDKIKTAAIDAVDTVVDSATTSVENAVDTTKRKLNQAVQDVKQLPSRAVAEIKTIPKKAVQEIQSTFSSSTPQVTNEIPQPPKLPPPQPLLEKKIEQQVTIQDAIIRPPSTLPDGINNDFIPIPPKVRLPNIISFPTPPTTESNAKIAAESSSTKNVPPISIPSFSVPDFDSIGKSISEKASNIVASSPSIPIPRVSQDQKDAKQQAANVAAAAAKQKAELQKKKELDAKQKAATAAAAVAEKQKTELQRKQEMEAKQRVGAANVAAQRTREIEEKQKVAASANAAAQRKREVDDKQKAAAAAQKAQATAAEQKKRELVAAAEQKKRDAAAAAEQKKRELATAAAKKKREADAAAAELKQKKQQAELERKKQIAAAEKQKKEIEAQRKATASMARAAKGASIRIVSTSPTLSVIGSSAGKVAPKGVATIVRWNKRSDNGISGRIYGSTTFRDGERVETSPIVNGIVANGNVVKTGSGSRYFLSDTVPSQEKKEEPIKSLLSAIPGATIQLTKTAKDRDAKKALAAVTKSKPSSTFSLFGLSGSASANAIVSSKTAATQSVSKSIPLSKSQSVVSKSTPVQNNNNNNNKSSAAPKGVPTIKRWRKNNDGSITGLISGSPNFKDGERITTSPIQKGIVTGGQTVQTGSGSKYYLE